MIIYFKIILKIFIELDDNLFQDNPENIYKDKSIYVLQYPKEKNACVSYGLLNNIDKNNIIYKCRIDNSSSCFPILNLQNNKVIGIHKNNSINNNIGTLLRFPIKSFFESYIKKLITINNIDYKIIKEIGKGGFGKVNQVLNTSDNEYYAIKEISIKDETEEKIKSFENEANILSKFNCSNLVKYYDSSKDNNNFYILMEFCDGENLRNFINKNMNNNTLIDENIIYNIIKQICLGIKEIHNKKIIHRDLKPENIFMNKNMEIKIGDFGISKELDTYKTYLLTTKKLGSEYYIAPEILDNGKYNEKSDLWSLGCIIYELFNLSIYFKDKFLDRIKKIDPDLYNYKWQGLIDSLLEKEYTKRLDINQVILFLEDYQKNNNNKDNLIRGEIFIDKDHINKDIRIINSFENTKREKKWRDSDNDWKYKNEKEIKENIEIRINGSLIEFRYYYKFKKEGKYIIEYKFKNNLVNICYMFYGCKSLTNLNLSNFNTQFVTNMSHMFYYCYSLANLNLSNFNTQNVTDMSYMFYGCKSLTNLNLSNFNTQNVTNMSYMFDDCSSLTNLNLSNFNNQNVTIMSHMFYGCKSLTNLNLTNFNTQNVTDMSWMFSYCSSLTNLNLSNFNTKNVTDMNHMFYGCKSLTSLNLSNFNTQNVTDMRDIFYYCESLKKVNLITKNNEIIEKLEN